MKQLIKRISRVADCSSADATAVTPPYRLLRSDAADARRPRRPRSAGSVPVYVGEEMRRFKVSADLVNHPVFAKLLNRSAQVYGFDQKGVIHIPCHVSDFQRVVDALRPGGCGLSADVIDLVDSISPPAAADDLFLLASPESGN